MQRKKIAIVGTGISGLVVAHRLWRDHDITLFEANDYVGGHTNTIDVELGGRHWAVDTGFIVFNDWTYPNFIALMDELGVPSQASNMSFSVHCDRTGLEYSGSSLDQLFAQRRNLFNPGFYRMIADILRFNREARALLEIEDDETSLGDYLDANGYSSRFVEHYVVPMGAAIWSADPAMMYRFPARYFIEFFKNHGMLSVKDRPTWRVIQGGSREYVRKLVVPFRDRIRLRTGIDRVFRYPDRVMVQPTTGEKESFDAIFLACHSDQALGMLEQPSNLEAQVLGAIPYQENIAVLHTDERMLPERPKTWSAWNYHIPDSTRDRVALTYNMNILQSLDAPVQFCVTLNREDAIRPDRVLQRIAYDHPVYTPEGVQAQARHSELNGADRTFFCGAYWGFGFHEDGVKSGLTALNDFQTWLSDEELYLRRAS
ncbi:MAG: FAD-dependent oxidoreductase [Chromatiales bacterium]|jgi:predicted NAD/FAD-binding protein|nr:FAD-dependent oxidoreductase [Chromatiales bacterium]